MGIELNESQKEAKQKVVSWWNSPSRQQIFRLAGYAGTGKSTIISIIIDELEIRSKTVFVTFTGKAAVVLNQKGLPATTIHRLIYVPEDIPSESRIITRAKKKHSKLGFYKVEVLPSDISLIVVDEGSMLSKTLLSDLSSFGIPILIVGDPMQLPPIDDDAHALDNPDYLLTDIVRQSKDNPVVKLSLDIREEGEIKPGKRYGDRVSLFFGKNAPDRSYKNADQVLCFKNNIREELNRKIRSFHGRSGQFPVEGDKLICMRNNWDVSAGPYPLINGCIGYVANTPNIEKVTLKRSSDPNNFIFGDDLFDDVLESAYSFRMLFQPDYTDMKSVIKVHRSPFEDCIISPPDNDKDVSFFDWGYCITVHKAQGSEFNKVLLFDDAPRHIGRDAIQKWQYTGVTRAKEKLIYVR